MLTAVKDSGAGGGAGAGINPKCMKAVWGRRKFDCTANVHTIAVQPRDRAITNNFIIRWGLLRNCLRLLQRYHGMDDFDPLRGLSGGYLAGIIKVHAMGKLILVRHGESQANRHHIFAEVHTPLTDLGRKQAKQVAGHIAARFNPTALVASPLERAKETAEIIGRELSLPVELM